MRSFQKLVQALAVAIGIAALWGVSTASAAVMIFVGPSGSCGGNGCFAPPSVTSLLSSYTYTDFNAGMPAGYSGTGTVVTGSVSGVTATPFGDTSPYLTIAGGQSTTLVPGGVHNVFGLYWGSADNYNKVEFFLANVLQDVFLGNDPRLTGLTANGGQLTASSNKYVSFVGLTFDKIRLSSTQNAFETDNHLIGDVPEPSMIALLAALGFALLCFARSRTRARI